MPAIPFTDEQLAAARETRGSVIVSAAAGSGKTAVLAERCAHLVCDAPLEDRCDVDELLVLTFTDASASEMRSRIVEAIRRRRQASADDVRLRRQLALADAAQISTIHAFCLWLIRRWFSHLSLDPSLSLLDENEMPLLKQEVLDGLLLEWYASEAAPQQPLGDVADDGAVGEALPATPAQAFGRLVADYGLGDDRGIASFVLDLFEFTASLPDPDAWLDAAQESHFEGAEVVVFDFLRDLNEELAIQLEHCEHVLTTLDDSHPASLFYVDRIRNYAEQVAAWSQSLEGVLGATPNIEHFEAVRLAIADFPFDTKGAPRLSKDTDADVLAARDTARECAKQVKEKLFKKRLYERFALFSAEECMEGLARTGPYVGTLVMIVRAFRERYAAKKRELNVLDFNDLERFAFDLLRGEEGHRDSGGVAVSLRRRFRHVLVDEFQDINPLQEAIIRLVSREPDSAARNNLFAVGDVKQSIYRFRLAEPAIFNRRLQNCRSSGGDDSAISLQRNFRSRTEILDATNLVFRQLMRKGYGAIEYDEEAELHCGRTFDADTSHTPVELHLMEQLQSGDTAEETESDDTESAEHRTTHWSDPAQWSVIEREAYLVGQRILALQGEGPHDGDGALRFKDIAILLRTTKVSAARVATVLTMMGVPACADVGGSLLAAREVRDVVAALEVLDNPQQDIPLAAVLRSGILTEPMSDDDLVEVRCLDRNAPFHELVRRYPTEGAVAELCERLATALRRINRYRKDARRRPMAELLWQLYEAEGFLGYVGGLPSGVQRRANLLKLHEVARQFGSFRKQGLHRFLRFIHSLDEQKREIKAAPTIGEGENVVRVLSVHQSKGLEFPVVFVAGLGTKINLGDRDGRMIFERETHIGLRVVDSDRMIQYPTIAHRRVAAEIERTTREEEMRILYVAMTRARDRLILIGSIGDLERTEARLRERSGRTPERLEVVSANKPLEWLLAALEGAPDDAVCRSGEGHVVSPLFEVHGHEEGEIAGWRLERASDAKDEAVRVAVARCEPLPAELPRATDDPIVEEVLARTSFVYPHLASASVRASLAASEFAGPGGQQAADAHGEVGDPPRKRHLRNPEQRETEPRRDDFQVPPSRYSKHTDPDAAVQRGLATHRALEFFDFSAATDDGGVASELHRLEREGVLAEAQCALVDREALGWLMTTPLAAAIRSAGDAYRREFMYIATEPLGLVDPTLSPPQEDCVLVRGVVDGILPVPDGIDLIDFKTDAVGSSALAARVVRYRPQLTMYARAMARIWRRPVQQCHLVFLSAREVVSWNADGEKA